MFYVCSQPWGGTVRSLPSWLYGWLEFTPCGRPVSLMRLHSACSCSAAGGPFTPSPGPSAVPSEQVHMGHFGRAFGPRVRRYPPPLVATFLLSCMRAMHMEPCVDAQTVVCVCLCPDACLRQALENGRLHEADGGGQACGPRDCLPAGVLPRRRVQQPRNWYVGGHAAYRGIHCGLYTCGAAICAQRPVCVHLCCLCCVDGRAPAQAVQGRGGGSMHH
jgi:hypothetical protein